MIIGLLVGGGGDGCWVLGKLNIHCLLWFNSSLSTTMDMDSDSEELEGRCNVMTMDWGLLASF
ncbi:hypothetical protein PanWU01x14_282850 [Parasponia andersonii]|uniref:Uncharacterized protein n=1 Tax=Parasponia andersonii TaxID=3476 RepID=A0A2P5B0K8_PARAD|nr:hypothetical protein PanWU01x14_282850 [Parasponia andersonii]